MMGARHGAGHVVNMWLTRGEQRGLRISGIRRLVMSTLVLGTHVGVLYSA
jgi:hypothetical protein